jgi:hypothetical protein
MLSVGALRALAVARVGVVGPKQVTARRRRHPRGMRGNGPSRDSSRSYLALVSVLRKDYGLAQGAGWAAWPRNRDSGISDLREGS